MATSTTRSSRGFTMIELLLVMVLIALVAGVVAISGGASTSWSKLHRDAQGIYGVCKHARTTAIAQSKRVRVEFDTLLRTYKMTVEEDPDLAADTFTSPEGSWSQVFEWDELVTVEVEDRVTGVKTATYVTFNPDGTADPIEIDVEHEAFKDKIRIDISELTGLATLEIRYD
jgi:type II secretion system protein H